jgi:hypothetical protein
MTANTSIEVVGVRDAIRSLNKIEPGLRKQFTADATRIAQPAIQEVQKNYTKVPLSGMARKWEQANKKIFPFSVAKAVSGVKLKVDASREATSLIYITQTNVAAAVFEAAGRANQNRLGDSLGQLRPNHTRILGPSVFRKRREIESELVRATNEVKARVERELK